MELQENSAPEMQQPSVEMDVDQLLNDINSPEPERPMTSEEAQPQQPQEPVAPQVQEYEFDWNGRKIKAPVEKLTKWASQGYDYSQKMEAFKKQQQDFDATRKAYEKYKVIDEYIQKDPQWWESVQEAYNNRLASEDPVVQRVKGLLEEQLAPVKEILAQKEQMEVQEKAKQEDTALDMEMKSIREKYKDLDFDTPDAEGKSLEYKVLEHAGKHGFPTFKSAFLDFHHEQLEKMWEARGREAISKDAQKRAKLGLSAQAPTPKAKMTDGFDVTGKSYDQIFKEVMDRLD